MSTIKFTSLLVKEPNSLLKVAIENPNQTQLEQDFGKLAYMFLKDRVPSLLPFIVGFEIVESNDDGSKAVGIFGAKIGDSLYSIPVFFINGQVKGLDSIYSKKTNTFTPLRESWINTLLNKQTIALGESADKENITDLRRTFEQPRFDFLAVPPNLPMGTVPKVAVAGGVAKEEGFDESDADKEELKKGIRVEKEHTSDPERAKEIALDHLAEYDKYYSKGLIPAEKKLKKEEKTSSVIDIAMDVVDSWNKMQSTTIDAISNDVEFQKMLAGAVAKLQKCAEVELESVDESPLVQFIKYEGGPKVAKTLASMLGSDYTFAKSAFEFYPDINSLLVTEFSEKFGEPKKINKNVVVTSIEEYEANKPHNDKVEDEDKKKVKLIKNKYIIEDNRDDIEKSEVYNVDYLKRFSNPTKSGLYNVLLSNGSCSPAWVLSLINSKVTDNVHNRSDESIVIFVKNNYWFVLLTNGIYVRDDELVDGPNIHDKAVDKDKLKLDKHYILVSDNGECFGPFIVKGIVSVNKGEHVINISLCPDYKHLRGDAVQSPPELYLHRGNHVESLGLYSLRFISHPAATLKKVGEFDIYVPRNWKFIQVVDPNDNQLSDVADTSVFMLGSRSHIMDMLMKNAFHTLLVGSDDGLDYFIRFDDDFVDGPAMSYKTAMVKLITKYGLSEKDAEDMLTEAKHNFKSRRMVKLAQQPLVGAAMPGDPGLSMGSDQFTGSMVIQPQVDLLRGKTVGQPALQNAMAPGFNLGSDLLKNLNVSELSELAARTGQKRVFDHAAIGSLAKIYDSNTIIDSYLPEFMQALDRLGRILFLFYWKNEEFADRYGFEDLADIEDMLKGVYRSFGDLILKLREKSVEPEDVDTIMV